jgi:acetyl-CoA carboxylase biotin carboxyl carrier protein
MQLTHEDVRKILEIVDSSEHLQEIELAYGGFRLHVRRGAGTTPASIDERPAIPMAPKPGSAASGAPARAEAAVEPALAEGEVAISAPMLGTFYRSPAPGDPAFVETGKRVQADDTVCLIEVMKLFSSIKAGVDGVVSRILVENGTMVEFDQMLIVIATTR